MVEVTKQNAITMNSVKMLCDNPRTKAIPVITENEKKNIQHDEGAITLAEVAKRCGWYSSNGLPHAQFAGAVARQCGIKTFIGRTYEDKYSQCVICNIDGSPRYEVFIRPAGFELIQDWYWKNHGGEDIVVNEYYKKDFGTHKMGDIKRTYCSLRENGKERQFIVNIRSGEEAA